MLGGCPRSIALTLALSACSFSIQGPRSKVDPGQCDRAAPGRKTVDVLGLLGTSNLAFAGIGLMNWCDPGYSCDKPDGAGIITLLLLTPPVLYTSALVVGTIRTSRCASAQDASLQAREARQRQAAEAHARRLKEWARCRALISEMDLELDPARKRQAVAQMPQGCREAAADVQVWQRRDHEWELAQAQEQQRRAAAERARKADEARQREAAEQARRAAEQQQRADEQRRAAAEQARRAEEQKRAEAEQAARAEEQKRAEAERERRMDEERWGRWRREARERCRHEIAAWRRERSHLRQRQLRERMPPDCQRLVDQARPH